MSRIFWFLFGRRKRFFFVGYFINNRVVKITGSLDCSTQGGELPSRGKLYSALKEQYSRYQFSIEDFIILSLYEFKSKREYNRFVSQHKQQ